ncbi:ABC transporter substrate-binding protein, partial [Nocardia tengchongensis]
MPIRIGYFPHNNSLFVLRHRGIVERTLPDVKWVDLRALPAAAPVDVKTALPSLHSDWLFTEGGYDVIGTGFTPPVTALANDRDIVYLGISGPRIENGRLVAKAGSGIDTVADLKGKRVGIAHGSWQTTLLLFALDRAGLGWA